MLGKWPNGQLIEGSGCFFHVLLFVKAALALTLEPST